MRVSCCGNAGSAEFRSALLGSLHFDLDEAWEADALALPRVDARQWGPRLRFSAPARLIEEFFAKYDSRLAAFLVYGSGDFHHLTALWIRRTPEAIIVVSFDNHPDWDVRPPRWACGAWVNRALELPHVRKISIWGCGNFECWWPGQIFGNRRAEHAGRLEVHPWADERLKQGQERRGAITRQNWREKFDCFVSGLNGASVYVTVDLDSLRPSDAITNWENGRFSTEDVAWAIGRLREGVHIIAGDICGAFSVPKYARMKQRFAAEWDHPKLPSVEIAEARRINHTAVERLWPLLTNDRNLKSNRV